MLWLLLGVLMASCQAQAVPDNATALNSTVNATSMDFSNVTDSSPAAWSNDTSLASLGSNDTNSTATGAGDHDTSSLAATWLHIRTSGRIELRASVSLSQGTPLQPGSRSRG